MVDFRYHLVSIISIFLALAVGIVLGAGPLDQPIDQAARESAQAAKDSSAQLRIEIEELENRLGHADAVVTAVAPRLVGDQLSGRSVVVVALPGTAGSTLGGARDALEAAGATVQGSVSLTDDWTAADRAEDLTETLAEAAAEAGADPAAGTPLPERAASALAGAVLTTDPETIATADEAGEALLKSLRDGGFLRIVDEPWERSALAVVLGPDVEEPDSTDPAVLAEFEAAQLAVLEVPRRVAGLAAGTVVAGPRGSARNEGVVAGVRDGTMRTFVSTVDDVDTAAGRISLAIAVVREGEDQTGHYGEGPDADAVLPELLDPPEIQPQPPFIPLPSPT